MWRIERVHDWLAHKLLQEDLKAFVSSDGHSDGVLRRLVAEDMDEVLRAALSVCPLTESVLGEVDTFFHFTCLGDTQR